MPGENLPTTQEHFMLREPGPEGWAGSRAGVQGEDLLTAAQLGLLETTQGLGVQGTGVGTERALGQLQGVIPGPGRQPAQAAVASQELGAEVPAEWVEGTEWSRGVWAPGVGMEPQGGTELERATVGTCALAQQSWEDNYGVVSATVCPAYSQAGHCGQVPRCLPPGQRNEAGPESLVWEKILTQA